MHLGLGAGDQRVDRDHVGTHLLRQVEMGDEVLYLRHPHVAVLLFVMMMRRVLMRVRLMMFAAVAARFALRALLLLAVYGDGDAGPGDAAFDAGRGGYLHTGDRERVHPFEEGGGVRVKLQQRRRQHVARGSHAAVKI